MEVGPKNILSIISLRKDGAKVHSSMDRGQNISEERDTKRESKKEREQVRERGREEESENKGWSLNKKWVIFFANL